MISASGSAGGRWLMGLTTLAVLLALAGSMRLVPGLRSSALEAETKQNLHAIQLALERYSVDSPGNMYPPWLSGGECEPAQEDALGSGIALDSLLAEGYLTAYPINPFAAQDRKQRELIALAQALAHDPLRPMDDNPSAGSVCRFGHGQELCGNVLANARMARQHSGSDSSGNPIFLPTGADTFFFCVDQPMNSASRRMLQGQFGYVPTNYHDQLDFCVSMDDGKSVPTGYQLLGWGAANRKGKNVLSTASLKRQRDANGAEMLGWEPTAIKESFLAESDIYGAVASNRELTEMVFIPTTEMPGDIEDGVCIVLSSGIDCRKGWVEQVPEVTASDSPAPDTTEDSDDR